MDLPSAVLRVSRLDGTARSWRVQLTSQTPFTPVELRNALVERFVGGEANPEAYTLSISGTFGAPIFALEERADLFGEVTDL